MDKEKLFVNGIDVSKLDVRYCEVSTATKTFLKAVKYDSGEFSHNVSASYDFYTVDYGQQKQKQKKVKDQNDNLIKITEVSEIRFLNMMEKNGWSLLKYYSGTNYLLEKKGHL